ncbi:MAG: hypothetical protein ACK4KT_08365 [Thermaurantimonas sp.]
MSKFIFFRTPKPKGFHYKPLYYNERKERIEQLKKELENDKSNREGSEREEFRIRLNSNIKRLRNTRSSPTSGQNIRLLVILFALFAIFWHLLKPLLSYE